MQASAAAAMLPVVICCQNALLPWCSRSEWKKSGSTFVLPPGRAALSGQAIRVSRVICTFLMSNLLARHRSARLHERQPQNDSLAIRLPSTNNLRERSGVNRDSLGHRFELARQREAQLAPFSEYAAQIQPRVRTDH